MRLLATLALFALAGGCGASNGDGTGAGGTGSGGSAGASGSSGSTGIPTVPGSDGCPTFQPCGGELDGHWLVREACVERDPELIAGIVASCPTSANAGMTMEADGSYDFELGLLTVDLEVTTTLTVAFTSDCARSLHTNLAALCAEYGDAQAADPQYSSTECAVAGNECRCTLVGVPATRNVFMNYEVTGNEFTDGAGGTTEFCVAGTELRTRTTESGDIISIGLARE